MAGLPEAVPLAAALVVMVMVKKKKQYIIYMGEKQVLTRGALLLKKLTTNYLTTQ